MMEIWISGRDSLQTSCDANNSWFLNSLIQLSSTYNFMNILLNLSILIGVSPIKFFPSHLDNTIGAKKVNIIVL